jgi:predicted adenylyl cyclase CyaB
MPIDRETLTGFIEKLLKINIDERGRIYIPRAVREKFSIKLGERLYIKIEDNHFSIYTPAAVNRLQLTDVQLEKMMVSRSPKAQHAMVELKARVADLPAVRAKLVRLKAKRAGIFHQIDAYYKVPKGRLKLREVEGESDADLIYYDRENVARPKRSSVFILKIPNPQTFKQILRRIVETRAVVDKVREIYSHEGIQIHLDVVKGLGSFVEFELVTSEDGEQQEDDLARLETLREQLGISSESLERYSYSDLV